MFPLVFLYFVMVFCVFLALQLKTLCFSSQISFFSAPIVIFFEFPRFFQHLHRPVFSCFFIIFSGLASDYLFFTFFVFLAFTIKNLMFLIHKLHIFGVACVFFSRWRDFLTQKRSIKKTNSSIETRDLDNFWFPQFSIFEESEIGRVLRIFAMFDFLTQKSFCCCNHQNIPSIQQNACADPPWTRQGGSPEAKSQRKQWI